MPLGVEEPQADVLQDDHRVARGNFADQVGEAGLEAVGHAVVLARRGKHFGLQAALPVGNIDLADEVLRRHFDARADQIGGERGGAALVFLLREERDVRHLAAAGYAFGPRVAQRHGLRYEAGATCKRGQKKSARQEAGAAVRGGRSHASLLKRKWISGVPVLLLVPSITGGKRSTRLPRRSEARGSACPRPNRHPPASS